MKGAAKDTRDSEHEKYVGDIGPVSVAERQAGILLQAIRGNARVRELAVNPLLLTVIALVQRYRAQLPELSSDGHVLIRHRGVLLGVGVFRSGSMTVESLYPKRFAAAATDSHRG